jgi:hypothetical protein
MAPKCSLPHSNEPATSSYPEPEHSSPWPPSHFMKINFNIILPSITPLMFQIHFFIFRRSQSRTSLNQNTQ